MAQLNFPTPPEIPGDIRSSETHLGATGPEEQGPVPAGSVSGGRNQERRQECRRCRLKPAPRRSWRVSCGSVYPFTNLPLLQELTPRPATLYARVPGWIHDSATYRSDAHNVVGHVHRSEECRLGKE